MQLARFGVLKVLYVKFVPSDLNSLSFWLRLWTMILYFATIDYKVLLFLFLYQAS